MKQQREARTIRECSSIWEYNGDDGKIAQAEIVVNYFSPTVAQLKAQRAEAKMRFEKDPDDIMWISEDLTRMIYSIEGLPEGFTPPSPITLEWLESQDLSNLARISEAIKENIELGKSRSVK